MYCVGVTTSRPTLLCVPIEVGRVDLALETAADARARGADLIEWRLDALLQDDPARLDAIPRLCRECPLPCIVTCRSVDEGGEFDGDASLLTEVAGRATDATYVDIEHARGIAFPGGTRTILSHHDFDGPPDSRLVLAMQVRGADVTKIAFKARSLRDNLEAFALLRHASGPMIALAMGEFGVMSRILAPKFGAMLTFARLGMGTAPGQPEIDDLLGLYRFRSIGPATRVYGIVGDPIGHSRSPRLHNAGFDDVGFDGVYVPMPIASSEDAEATYASLKGTILDLLGDTSLDFHGCSITLPFKEHIVRLGEAEGWDLDEHVRRIGAANTLVRDGTTIRLRNTDAEAACGALEDAMGEVTDRVVGIRGAGGAARAIAAALSSRGADVHVFNRHVERAQRLASDLGVHAHHDLEISNVRCDALVNCTPIGMSGGPAPDEVALPVSAPVIFDTVYNPIETPLLKAAREAGCTIVDGVTMFVRQAAAQFELWTGVPAPIERFDRLIRG
ncbi:MAG: type I 3-dehydroquinate dehydratase [Phycisphaerales bacterium]|nr:type I 3-dehydroquinate dehydratase [Phycisphaerales bacterium]